MPLIKELEDLMPLLGEMDEYLRRRRNRKYVTREEATKQVAVVCKENRWTIF